MAAIIILIIFYGIIALCAAGSQEADIKNKLQKKLSEEENKE